MNFFDRDIIKKYFIATIALMVAFVMLFTSVSCDFEKFSQTTENEETSSESPSSSIEESQFEENEESSSVAISSVASSSAASSEATTKASINKAKEDYKFSSFEVHFIDVGQGDAALIICDGQVMMMDGGPADASNVIYTYLKKHKIKKIDYILCSHPEADHIGGLSGAVNYLINECGGKAPKKAYCSDLTYDTKTFKSFKKYLGEVGTKLEEPKNGTSFLLGGAKVTIYRPSVASSEGNNNSLIVRVAFGRRAVLFPGDSEYDEEIAFVRENPGLKCDILKVAHHGSRSSSSNTFLNAMKPVCAVICCGKNNSYGHPHDNVLSRIKKTGMELYRTDLQGDVVIRCSGDDVSITTAKKTSDVFASFVQKSVKETSAKKKSETKSAAKQTTKSSSDSGSGGAAYILNTSSKKFHYPSCSSVKKMKESNKKKSNASRQSIIDQGYAPCKICKP